MFYYTYKSFIFTLYNLLPLSGYLKDVPLLYYKLANKVINYKPEIALHLKMDGLLGPL